MGRTPNFARIVGVFCFSVYRRLLFKQIHDNVQAESLWSRLKTEVLEVRERTLFADLVDAQRSVADYFDYYSHERLHSSIDYQTPYHTHQQLLQLNALNCPALLVLSQRSFSNKKADWSLPLDGKTNRIIRPVVG